MSAAIIPVLLLKRSFPKAYIAKIDTEPNVADRNLKENSESPNNKTQK